MFIYKAPTNYFVIFKAIFSIFYRKGPSEVAVLPSPAFQCRLQQEALLHADCSLVSFLKSLSTSISGNFTDCFSIQTHIH